MSFTTIVKNEVCSLEFPILENIAELSGFIRSCGKYSYDKIEITIENIKVAKRIYTLLKNIYNVEIALDKRKMANFSSKSLYVIIVETKVKQILNDLSVLDDFKNYIESPREYIIGSIDEIKAYLRGSFLGRGSINDPSTSQYHLEFVYDNKYEAVFIQRLLNQFEMNCKIIIRDSKYMVYIKESEKISDFLKIINASKAVLYYENVRIKKEQKNNTNRLNNCEQANTDKVIATAMEQIKYIEFINLTIGLNILDEKLKETCSYRLKYPEASLNELSQIISIETNKKISKSCLNHRFRKIKEIYEKIKSTS